MKFEALQARHLPYLGPASRFLISFAQPTFKKTPFNRSKNKRPGAEILISQNGQDPDAAGPPEIKLR
jgi:hypothetical protein